MMPPHSSGPVMSQKIFSMNLDVPTVSLYLLCCAVAEAGASVSRRTLLDKWNDTEDALDRELARLEDRNILRRIEEDRGEAPGYRIVEERQWRL
ncbi:MAG: hypothetical protein WBY88_04900 [Desulfosarcina sp.]